MVAGFWLNQDGLPLQFGTQKVIPELGGDFLMYGENREVESYINLGATSFGNNVVQNPALPSSFVGTGTPNAAGIVSMTTLFPLMAPAITGDSIPPAGNSAGVLNILQPHLWIDQVDLECLVAANAGTGGGTGLTGIGLVTVNENVTPTVFVQVTPNAGTQLLGLCANARMTAGAHYTWYSDGTAFGTGTPPTAPSWLGNVPAVTNSITPLPTNAFISAIASAGTFTGASAAGLLKLRIRYNYYGDINQ
jgi:hypothetical protein